MSDTIKVISITELEAIEKLREEFRANAVNTLSDSDLKLLDDVIEKANAFDLMGIDPDLRTMNNLVYMTYDQPRDCAASDAWPGDQLLAKAKEHREGLKNHGELVEFGKCRFTPVYNPFVTTAPYKNSNGITEPLIKNRTTFNLFEAANILSDFGSRKKYSIAPGICIDEVVLKLENGGYVEISDLESFTNNLVPSADGTYTASVFNSFVHGTYIHEGKRLPIMYWFRGTFGIMSGGKAVINIVPTTVTVSNAEDNKRLDLCILEFGVRLKATIQYEERKTV